MTTRRGTGEGGRWAVDPGDLFQERFWGLLRRGYRPEQLIELPAELGGDYGIEGYSTDGIAYQCYEDRDSPTLQNRTSKQKQKLYRDLQKLRTNAVKLEGVLGPVRLKHYFLIVPSFHAAELVSYAMKQAEVVRSWGLSFVDPDFTIHIKTPQDYPAELAAALRDDATKALIPEPVIDEADVGLFPSERPELVKVLDEKIEDLEGDARPDPPTSLRDYFVRAFLAKEQVMEALGDWPQMWDAVERRRQSRQELLELQSHLSSEPANTRVLELVRDYEGDLIENVGGLVHADAQRIALGQVAEWLMRCPLRFRASV